MRRMQRFYFWFLSKLQWLTAAAATLLIPLIFRTYSSQKIPVSRLVLDLSLILLVMLAMTTFIALQKAIAREVDRSRVTVTFHYKTALEDGDHSIYEPIIQRLSRAKDSIKILGSLRSPGPGRSTSRENYFEMIERIVQQKIAVNNRFTYERIVQLDDCSALNDEEDLRSATTLTASRVDDLLYSHCQRVKELTQNSSRVQFWLHQARAVLPIVTLVIIDEEYIILCLPWLDMKDNKMVDTQLLGKGLFFHDREGRDGTFSTEMDSLFSAIVHNHSQPVLAFNNDREGGTNHGGA